MKDNKTVFCIQAEIGVALIIALIANASAATPTISNVTAQQRYPWNGKVDVTYTVTGEMPSSVVLKVSATDRETGSNYVASTSALTGDMGLDASTHRFVWDMSADGLIFKSTNVLFKVEATPALYCVIDLSGGASMSSYPISYLEDVPSGGWTDEYKTKKLVLRWIKSGSFKMGGSYDVTLTKPFYLGVFEVTQKQYELVMGCNPSCYKGDKRPVEQVSYNDIRGSSDGSQWPLSAAVDADSFIGKIQVRTGLIFDLPTEAQWEYACRAGTTNRFNNGGDSMDNIRLLGRCYDNRSDGYGGYSEDHTTVGSYLPNAWGLYDMHGNVWEWCLDWHGALTNGTDPQGKSSGSSRVLRGGSFLSTADRCTADSRGSDYPSAIGNQPGFRIVRTLPNTEVTQWHELVSESNHAYIICYGESQIVAIDSRIGVRESLGNETIKYSSLWNGYDGATVTIEQNGAVLAENLAGNGEFMWHVNCDGIFTLMHTTYTNGVAGEQLSAMFVVDRISLDPLIIEPSGGVFADTSQTISLSCATEGATICYTTDGSDPRTSGREYTKPFTVYKSCTVRAVSSMNGWIEYPEATATFTRSESLSEAANLYGYTMETGGDASWTVNTDVSHDGVSSVRSGVIDNDGTTYLQTSVRKAGTVSFWWKAMCEEAEVEDGETYYYDFGAFSVDGTVKAQIAGNDTGWQFVSVDVPSGGKHTLRWEYTKDDATSYSPDCIWLDQVQWIPADGSGHTLTTPDPVPYSWLSSYGLGLDSDFESAAKRSIGKRGDNGRAWQVWQDYVAGTDPTNVTSVFTSSIEMKDGMPLVTWSPNLNSNGVVRVYTVMGKEKLTDAVWQTPTNSTHRFFKVKVELP